MSALLNLKTSTASNMLRDSSRLTMIRIAVPSFKTGWRKSKDSKNKNASPTREELQELFGDELRAPKK